MDSHDGTIVRHPPQPTALAIPEVRDIQYRAGVVADIPFLDQMQALHANKLGFQYRRSYEKAIEAGNQILLATDRSGCPMGFIYGKDRYSGQDNLGIVYQLAVVPLRFRHKIGANLLAHFIRGCAWGMRLLGCYCAQDLAANHFWESMGFLPLAFRTGSRRTQRLHIYWQRRIRIGDTATPLWFPHTTHAGAVREDRAVLPFPAGRHWSDPLPTLLQQAPETRIASNGLPVAAERKRLPAAPPVHTGETYTARIARLRENSKHLKAMVRGKIRVITAGGVQYVPTADNPEVSQPVPPKPKRVSVKVDPAMQRALREVRDKAMELVNSVGLIERGIYDPSRRLDAGHVDFVGLLTSGNRAINESPDQPAA